MNGDTASGDATTPEERRALPRAGDADPPGVGLGRSGSTDAPPAAARPGRLAHLDLGPLKRAPRPERIVKKSDRT